MSDQGRIKWFNNASGWGFIAGANGKDILIRHEQILSPGFKTLYAGDLVAYEAKQTSTGSYAVNVTVLETGMRTDERQAS